MPLGININEHSFKIIVIALSGRLDAFEAPGLRKLCDDFIAQNEAHFVLDLTDLNMLDSAGLAVMVSVLKRARQQGGDVRLIWPVDETAGRILRLTKFDQVFSSITRAEILPGGF
ncbi:MAG: STAS domain-containing protein [Chloroflexota bacterium]